MAVCKVQVMFNTVKLCSFSKMNFSTTYFLCNKWRREQNLEPNPNSYGPMTNLPDYSFVDGRPVGLSLKKAKALELQKKYCETIAELSDELDVGLEYYYTNLEKEEKEREAILNNKLKAKGAALLHKIKKTRSSKNREPSHNVQ